MFYKDESSGEKPGLMSNNDLDFALQRNDKLIIYVEYNWSGHKWWSVSKFWWKGVTSWLRTNVLAPANIYMWWMSWLGGTPYSTSAVRNTVINFASQRGFTFCFSSILLPPSIIWMPVRHLLEGWFGIRSLEYLTLATFLWMCSGRSTSWPARFYFLCPFSSYIRVVLHRQCANGVKVCICFVCMWVDWWTKQAHLRDEIW